MTGRSKVAPAADAPAAGAPAETESLEARVARLRLEVEALELERRLRVLERGGGGARIEFFDR